MFEAIVGHSLVLRLLRRALETGRIPHAYLFLGPSGVGKAKIARALASAMVGGAERAESNLHPDIREIHPQGSSLCLNQVRELNMDVLLAPALAQRKVYILHNIEALTTEAANSFLTMLEEPPASAHFILLADRPSVFGTIVSRCQVLRFGFLTVPETVQVLERLRSHTADLEAAARLSFGSPGEAMRSLEPEACDRQREMATLAQCIMELTGAEKLHWMARLEEKKDDLHAYVAFLAFWMRDVLCLKLALRECLVLPYREEIEAQARSLELNAITARFLHLQELLTRWNPSTNKRLVLDQLFLALK
ncbi:MAG: DNA polymerase III subunit tau [Firmicutes bacterium]|nr:DNA polymerase III subunit tau [Bacillota bacterium]